VQADFDHFLALDDPTVNLIAIVKVTGSLGTVTGKHVFLPALFFDSKAKQPFVAQEKRTTPVDVHYPNCNRMMLHITCRRLHPRLPVAPTSAAWPDHAVVKIASQAVETPSRSVALWFITSLCCNRQTMATFMTFIRR